MEERLVVTWTRLVYWGPSADCTGCLNLARFRRAPALEGLPGTWRYVHTLECTARFLLLGTGLSEREMQVAKGNKMVVKALATI